MSGDGDRSNASAYDAAPLVESIQSLRPEILAAYEDRLVAAGNLVARDPLSLQQALANAEQILSDVVASLLSGRVHVDDKYKLIAWDIGVTRAADGVHPKESLQAASIFFQTALSALAHLIGPGGAGVDQHILVVLALEQSIALRIRESVAGYTGFLLNKVHGAQIQERRRIARDLHDRIGNGVSVAQRQLELYNLYRTSQPGRAGAKVEVAQLALKETMQNLRTVTSSLHAHEPLQNLEKSLRAYLNSADVPEVTIRLKVNGDETWASDAVLDETLLIVREAAANALRYAAASMLLVTVDITPNDVRASIEDNGCGFDPSRIPDSAGVGLASMRERAELLDGSLHVHSRIGHGTQVDLWVPLDGQHGAGPA